MVLLDDGGQRLLKPKAVKQGVQALLEDKHDQDDEDTDSSDDEEVRRAGGRFKGEAPYHFICNVTTSYDMMMELASCGRGGAGNQ